MTASRLLLLRLAAMAAAVAAFSPSTHHNMPRVMAARRPPSRMHSLHGPSGDGHLDAVQDVKKGGPIRPVLLSTAVAASVFASLPALAHADAFDGHPNHVAVVHPPTSTVTITQSTAVSVMPSLQLASSTLANPIGESQDGSDSGINSFGQWFFVLYVVVSLLAGGKEVLSRIQKQMDKDS